MSTIKSIKAKVARVTRLDACGSPAPGAKASLVTDGFVNIGVDPSYDDGEEFRQKNAWGDWCINERDNKRLIEMGLSIEFCAVHVDALEMTTGGRLLGAALGIAFGESEITQRFALEAWSKVPGPCAGTATWLYWLFPNVGAGSLGGWSLANETLTMTVEAVTDGAPSAADWVQAGPEPYPISHLPVATNIAVGDHFAVAPTTTAPPAVTAGAVALV